MPQSEQGVGACRTNSSSSTRAVLRVAALSFFPPLALAASAHAAAPPYSLPHDTLYIESNNPVAGQNAVLAYHRNQDGSLTPLPGSPFLTGGTGFFDPTYAVGPFDGQGIMAADPVGGVLFVPNGGSDSIAALRMRRDGSLYPVAGSPFATSGNTPEALGMRDRTLVIVDNATDPNQAGSGVGPSYETARLGRGDSLIQNTSATIQLPAGTLPTQALPVPGTPLVYTNEFLPGTLSSYFLDLAGRLHLIERQAPPLEAGEASQPVPLGQAINPAAPFLYVGLPNVARVAVYRMRQTGELGFVRTVANSGAAVCWLHVSKDSLHLYTANTGDHSISVYDLTRPEQPVERQHLVLNNAAGGVFDFALSPDERFLYAVEEESSPAASGLSNQVHILSIDHATGQVAEIAASPLKLPVAAGTRPQGVVVY